MIKSPLQHHQEEWIKSAIHPSLIALNLRSLAEDEIAEWYFQNLPNSSRRNDGRIRDGYLNIYKNPLKDGYGIEGYDPNDFGKEPELRTFKPDVPRIDRDGKPIKYDTPKNSKHNPILPRISYEIASKIFRNAGLNFLELTKTYAPEEVVTGIDDAAECKWFWIAVLDNPSILISITEGGKKCLSLLSQGKCAIAVTSITTWRAEKGSNKLHPWLALFAPKRHFYLTFDQDIKRKTQRAVNSQSFKLGHSLIKASAIRVKRISWSGTAKGIDDFIFTLQQSYGDRYTHKILRKCYQNARDYRNFDKSSQIPGHIKPVNTKYLELGDVKKAANYKILVVKSAKGTNKTGILEELVERDRQDGTPTINLSHIERLARELGDRLDLPYRTEKDSISLRNALGYSLCIDSFNPDNSVPFHPEQWQDAGLSIDEFTQVLEHLAFGTTELRKYRRLVLATLGQKLADCWTNDKPIRLLDADTNAESIELIYELIQIYSDQKISREELEKNTFTLVNEYRPLKGDLHFYNEPSPKQVLADLTEKMKNSNNLFILSSAQKSRSKDGTINLEKKARKYYKLSEILRIDSQTTSDPEHKAFGLTGERLRTLINTGQYKVIIASPTICTGISIDGVDDYFDAVFSFQSGNITPNSVRQQLVRLRDFKVPRYLWCPKIGKGFIGSKSTNPIELLTDQKGQAKLSLGLLGYKEAEQLIKSNICPLTKYWATVGAQRNLDNYHYREILLADLEAEGWNIIERSPNSDSSQLKAAWAERQEIQKESIREEHNAIASAKDLTQDQAKELDRKDTKTSIQEKQLLKHNIKQKYSVSEVSPELVKADSKKLYSSLQLRFWLTIGREYLENSEREIVAEQIKNNHGNFFIPDLNSKTKITQVKLLELFKPYLEKFQQPDTEWSNKSPELIELKEFVFQDLVRFNQILSCGIAATDSPITVVQKILKVIGLRLSYLKNKRDGKKRLRIYGAATSRFEEMLHLEDHILNAWKEKVKLQYTKAQNFSLVSDGKLFFSGAA